MTRAHFLAATLLALATVRCGAPPPRNPNALLEITSPVEGLHSNAASLSVQVASHGLTPDRVELHVDGGSVAVATTAPYVFSLPTAGFPDGPLPLVAEGFADQTNWLSAPVNVVLDRVAPTVLSRTPAPDAGNVDLGAPIQVTFSEPIDPASIPDGGVVLQAVGVLPARTDLSSDGLTLTVNPQNALVGPQQLSVVLPPSLTDLAGNPLTLPADAWAWKAPALVTLDTTAVAGTLVARRPVLSLQGGSGFLISLDQGGINTPRVFQYQSFLDRWTALPGLDEREFDGVSGTTGAEGTLWLLEYKAPRNYTQSAGYGLRLWQGAGWSTQSLPPLPLSYMYGDEVSTGNRPVTFAGNVTNDLAFGVANTSASNQAFGTLDVAVLSKNSWALLPRPLGDSVLVNDPRLLYLMDGSLLAGGYLGGNFRLARWDGTDWTPLTPDLGPNVRLVAAGTQAFAVTSNTSGTLTVRKLSGVTWADLITLPAPQGSLSGFTALGLPTGDLVVGEQSTDSNNNIYLMLQRYRAGRWTELDWGKLAPPGGDILLDASGRTVVLQYGTTSVTSTLVNER